MLNSATLLDALANHIVVFCHHVIANDPKTVTYGIPLWPTQLNGGSVSGEVL